MEKITMCVLYYFDDKNTRYYFESKVEAECLRFCAYKKYDMQRISKRNFNVPVSLVGKILVPENELHKYPISSVNNVKVTEKSKSEHIKES